jgi:Zn-dependent peptidase ImmA (M78 family)/transcriptional regulator with XRE-family HTH domain
MAARSTEALVEPAILIWARTSAGLTVDEAAQRLQTKSEKLAGWENGNGSPSMGQLRRMAQVYKRLLSDFYLPAQPDEAPLPHDFRRLPGEVAHRYSRALRYQLRQSRDRRNLALDLASELDSPIPTLPQVELGRDPEQAGTSVRDLLGISVETQLAWHNERRSYNAWRAAIEHAGVLVFQATGIALTEILGFSLSERPLPVIGVNRKLAPNGRTFTLLHEFVHVLLGTSSICDIEEEVLRPPEEQRPEVYCNAVAAAALVPLTDLRSHKVVASSRVAREWTDDELATLGRTFGASNEVILRRLLTAGLATQAFYVSRRAMWRRLFDATPRKTDEDMDFKRNMPQEVVSDLGRPFTRLVLDSYENAQTSLADVSRYLGLRAQQVEKVRALMARA